MEQKSMGRGGGRAADYWGGAGVNEIIASFESKPVLIIIITIIIIIIIIIIYCTSIGQLLV